MAENRKITLHPLREDGTMDMSINLCPKTLVSGLMDSEGNLVEVVLKEDLASLATKEELSEGLSLKADKSEIPTNYVTTDSTQVIFGNKTFSDQTDFVGQVNIWDDAHITVLKNGDGNYGLLVPSSTTWTNNKTIATTEDCGTKLYRHHIVAIEHDMDTIEFDIISTLNTQILDETHLYDNVISVSNAFKYIDNRYKFMYTPLYTYIPSGESAAGKPRFACMNLNPEDSSMNMDYIESITSDTVIPL